MNEELEKKILKIGKKIIDEFKLHNREVRFQMTKMVSGNYIVEANAHYICHISEDELIYLREHRND